MLKRILYLGWLGRGNLGDELLFDVFKDMFYGSIDRSSSTDEFTIDAWVLIPGYRIDLSRYDLVVLGGGSLLDRRYWLDICKEVLRLRVPLICWATGIDGMFKAGVSEFRQGLAAQGSSEILELVRQVVGDMSYVSCRGPYTVQFLEHAGVDRSRITEVVDPVLFYSSPDPDPRPSDDSRVLVNWGTSGNKIFGGDEAAVAKHLTRAIEQLLSDGYEVTIYPVWAGDIPQVFELARGLSSSITVVPEVLDAAELLRLIRSTCMTIDFKLHASILSAVADRPFVALAYRGKYFDFAETVGCLDCCLPTDEVTWQSIYRLVEATRQNTPAIVARFQAARAKYRPVVEQGFRVIHKLLQN